MGTHVRIIGTVCSLALVLTAAASSAAPIAIAQEASTEGISPDPATSHSGGGWTNTYGDPGPSSFSSANAVAVGDDGSIYVAGPFFGTFNGKTAVDEFDLFLMKLDSSGEILWTQTWDPDSMDGIDWSQPYNSSSREPWNHNSSYSDVVIDAQGNVWLTISGFLAVVDVSGTTLAASEAWASPNAGPLDIHQLRPQASGGMLATIEYSNRAIVGINPDLSLAFLTEIGEAPTEPDPAGIEWNLAEPANHRFIDGVGQGMTLVPAGDGTFVLSDIRGEFDFQANSQSIVRLAADGSVMWSTLHAGRCTGPLDANSQHQRGAAFLSGDNILVQSYLTEAQFCDHTSPDGFGSVIEMAAYSQATGELAAIKAMNPNPFEAYPYAYACTDDVTGLITGWYTESADIRAPRAPCDLIGTRIVGWIPSIGTSGLDAYGLAQGHNNAPALVHFIEESDRFTILEVQNLTVGQGSSDVYDISVSANGEAVVVGRVSDSAALLGTAGALAETSPQAFVTFGATPRVGRFTDDDASIFEADIEWLAESGVTRGCGDTKFCPESSVTRGQMAAFLVRALNLTDIDPAITFTDTADSIFEQDILRLATAGITKGCGDGTVFCPDASVTRGQMAAFLVRALDLPAVDTDVFADDDTSIFEADINRLAASGITKGCGTDRFCPDATVTRGQMAAFLRRALS